MGLMTDAPHVKPQAVDGNVTLVLTPSQYRHLEHAAQILMRDNRGGPYAKQWIALLNELWTQATPQMDKNTDD